MVLVEPSRVGSGHETMVLVEPENEAKWCPHIREAPVRHASKDQGVSSPSGCLPCG